MKILTSRFGEIEIDGSKIIHMPDGIIGIRGSKKFVIIDNKENQPFIWYQSVENEELAFVIANPLIFDKNYHVNINDDDMARLRATEVSQLVFYVIITIPKDPMQMTANLLAPLVINKDTLRAIQIVLIQSDYLTKHPLPSTITATGESPQVDVSGRYDSGIAHSTGERVRHQAALP